jgi:hypothetical protein
MFLSEGVLDGIGAEGDFQLQVSQLGRPDLGITLARQNGMIILRESRCRRCCKR